MKYYSENEVISILINTCKELCKDKIYKPETYMTFREKIDERPSIELPDKHGRLIEADEVDEAISESLRNGEITGGSAGLFTAIVHNASTIVPSTVH